MSTYYKDILLELAEKKCVSSVEKISLIWAVRRINHLENVNLELIQANAHNLTRVWGPVNNHGKEDLR